MKALDVAIITPGSFVIPSGKSSSVELVVEQVARRLSRSVRLAVFGRASRARPAAERHAGVHYIRVPAPRPLAYIRHVSRKLAKLRPQIIQVENRPRFVQALRRRHKDAQIWLSLHSVTFVSRPYLRPSELRRCLAAADLIIVNSEFLRQEIERREPMSKDKIVVNHLGVDTDRFVSRWSTRGEARRQQLLAKLNLTGRPVLMYVGRLIRIKGVHHLMKAMPEIIRQVPRAKLLVVGSAFYGSKRTTPYVRRLKRIGKRLRGHVRFVPYVPHEQIDAWFPLADALVVPSARHEAFGLVNVEAMAAGVPVVASGAGGMTEIIEDGETGRLVDPERITAALEETLPGMLSDPELIQRMGQRSRDRALAYFSWEQTAARWLELYRMIGGLQRGEGHEDPPSWQPDS